MIPLPLPNRSFMQLCWVVPDLNKAVDGWLKAGVGPFFTAHAPQHESPNYRGKPIGLPPLDVAMGQAGDVQIELICQLDDQQSIFRELVPAGQTGFHHVALYSKDFDADVAYYARSGSHVIYSGKMMSSRVCWVDTVSTLGFMVEILERKDPMIDVVFDKIRNAADTWNGEEPIRALG
jgi:hypothetical protein